MSQLISELSNLIPKIANIASIAGALISLYVVVEVRSIGKKYLFRARVPEILKAMKTYSSALSEELNTFEDSIREIETELSRIDATLKNLTSKIEGETKRMTKELRKLIRERSRPCDRGEIWEIYNRLQALTEDLVNIQQDFKWSR